MFDVGDTVDDKGREDNDGEMVTGGFSVNNCDGDKTVDGTSRCLTIVFSSPMNQLFVYILK